MKYDLHGVIFDMDGLLFDSERLGVEVIVDAGKKQGKNITREFIHTTLGITNTVSMPMYERAYPGLDPVKLFEDFGDGMRALAVKGQIPLKKGARELLCLLREKGVPCALASSSPEEYVRLYLESQEITEYFSVILGGPKGIHSKPEPDIFLLAAEKMGVDPVKCLVLEDSPNGVKAGRAAGATVCMVPDLIPFTTLLAPYVDRVARDLNEAGEIFFG